MNIIFYKRGNLVEVMKKTILKNYTMSTRIHHGKVIADIIPNNQKGEYYHLDLNEYILKVK